MERLFASIVAGGAVVLLAGSASAQGYVLVELPVLGTFGSRAFDIDDSGNVVGRSLTPSLQQHAVAWLDGELVDLSPSNAFAEAQGLAEGGAIAGWMRNPAGSTEAVRWIAGTPQFLGMLPGHIGSFAQDANAAGLVAGWSTNTVGDPVAVVWDGAGPPEPLGDTFSWAFAVSEQGHVVGRRWLGVEVQGFRWHDGEFDVLPGLGAGHVQAVGVSRGGRIAGTAASPFDGKLHGVVWDHALATTDLGVFLGTFATAATDVNDDGVAVGGALDQEGELFRALVWRGQGAEDLEELVPAGTPWALIDAQSINERGEIVGQGFKVGGGALRPFLLRPDCDEDGVEDLREIAFGTAHDANGDGQADACQHCQADLGFASADGPELSVCGDALVSASAAATLAVEGTATGATVLVVVGTLATPTPLLGGALVPSPPIVLSPLVAGASGAVAIPVQGLDAPRASVFVQALEASPAGVALSNAVEVVLGG